MIVLDLVFPEVANAVWKSHRQGLITIAEARNGLAILQSLPFHVEPATRLIDRAFEIGVKYDRAIYDALFVALVEDLQIRGVTADEPLFNTTRGDFASLMMLRDWP